MPENHHIDINCQQRSHEDERICGDVFVNRRIKEENRIIAVLSDGMGHGVKANMLATLTSTMALNFTIEHKDFEKIAEVIMKTLPVCSQRKMSYSTFTIVDIEIGGKVSMLGYDNPQPLIIRNARIFDPGWQNIILTTDKYRNRELRSCAFSPEKDDRIVLTTDGITQSGLGTDRFPLGWGHDGLKDFLLAEIKNNNLISSRELGRKVIKQAYQNDGFALKDDASCAVINFRDARKILICTGPPFDKTKDHEYAAKVLAFEGKKVLCGATTGDIIAREWGTDIRDTFEFTDPDLPPVSFMDGVDLITEGILTLTKVSNILRDYTPQSTPGKGAADRIVQMMLACDEIDFIVGTRINVAHQDPTLPVELEIRRNVVKGMTSILEGKFLKVVEIEFF